MTPCKQVQATICGAWALEEVSADDIAHAEGCDRCGPVLEEMRTLALLAIRGRRALEAEGDLAPSAWVRVRAGVDAATETSPVWRWITAIGVAAAAAAALFVALAGSGVFDAERPGVVRAPGLAIAPEAPAAPVVASIRPAVEAGEALAIANGTIIEAGETERVIEAFGRHRVIVTPGARVSVASWSAKKMTLRVQKGTITCDVNRAEDEDVFEVFAGDVRVRVLGTVFTVARAERGGVTVSVARGRVAVQDNEGAVREVAAGETTVVPPPRHAAADDSVEEQPASAPRAADNARVARGNKARDPRLIEVNIPPQRMDPGDSPHDYLATFSRIIASVRAGQCQRALNALRAIAKGDASPPATTWYLMAWCQRKLGQLEASTRNFARYKRLAPAGRWTLPTGPRDLPPTPSVTGLSER